jgi:cell division septation protein DedD
MPNLNVKGDAPKGGGPSAAGAGGVPKIVIIVVAAIVALGAILFVLNTTGIVKLWGKKTPKPQVVALPEENYQPVSQDTTPVVQEQAMPAEQAAPAMEENLTKVESSARAGSRKAAPAKNVVRGTGMYTVQISSWPSQDKADGMAKVFSDAGFDAFVEPMGSFYRVCVGRFETKADAKSQMEKMEHMLESRPVIAKVGK